MKKFDPKEAEANIESLGKKIRESLEKGERITEEKRKEIISKIYKDLPYMNSIEISRLYKLIKRLRYEVAFFELIIFLLIVAELLHIL